MLNKSNKSKKTKTNLTKDHRTIMKYIYIAAIVVFGIGLILSGLAWGGFIPTSL